MSLTSVPACHRHSGSVFRVGYIAPPEFLKAYPALLGGHLWHQCRAAKEHPQAEKQDVILLGKGRTL